ncbi:MAG: MmcB family DNA repair protein [Geminicoccaceae bacterium]
MPDATLSFSADWLARGICRAVEDLGYAAMTEFPLGNGRRVDVIAVAGGGETLIVEIKCSVADFRADRKWIEYLPYCDLFYFAVPDGFPLDLLPDDCGLMVADAYGAAIRRPAPRRAMNGSRRRALTLRLALTASQRLRRAIDPRL